MTCRYGQIISLFVPVCFNGMCLMQFTKDFSDFLGQFVNKMNRIQSSSAGIVTILGVFKVVLLGFIGRS